MIDHELTDPTGSALTITHDHQGVWVTATEDRDEVTVGPFPVTSLTEAVTVESDAEVSGDLMDGGVTAAAIEAEVVSPGRARSLVQERDELAEALDTTMGRAIKAERERDRWRKYRDGQAAENPRPLTAREHLDAAWKAAHVTDGRGVLAGDWFLERFSDGTIVTARATWSGMPSGDVRLVRPPAPSRPEGAEEIEQALSELDDLGGDVPAPTVTYAQRVRLADLLAERGVRVTGAES